MSRSGLAVNETFERKDDIGFKDVALPVSITYHAPSTSAGVPSTQSNWVTIQVETPIPQGDRTKFRRENPVFLQFQCDNCGSKSSCP